MLYYNEFVGNFTAYLGYPFIILRYKIVKYILIVIIFKLIRTFSGHNMGGMDVFMDLNRPINYLNSERERRPTPKH